MYVPEDWILVIVTVKINDLLVCKMEMEDLKDLLITENSLSTSSFKKAKKKIFFICAITYRMNIKSFMTHC